MGLQAELIAEAGELGFEPWKALVRSTAALLDDDGAFDPDEDLARNQLHLVDTIDGITFVDGQLVGEHALTVTQALNAKADELFRRFVADHERCPDLAVPDRKTLLALALVELCRAGFAVDINTTRPPRPEVTLVVGTDEPDDTTDTRGVKLQDGTTRVLRCDPDLYAVVVDSLGQPIDLGRHVRLASTAQRRALTIRDGWCVFPGCDLPIQWCDAHHVDHFEHGGPTNLRNLAPLCRHHHGVSHRRDWPMHATDRRMVLVAITERAHLLVPAPRPTTNRPHTPSATGHRRRLTPRSSWVSQYLPYTGRRVDGSRRRAVVRREPDTDVSAS